MAGAGAGGDATSDHTRPPPAPRTDLATAAVLLAFALAVVWQSAAMPTFTDSGGDPFTAPGIVPGFYGVVIALLAVALGTRSMLRIAARTAPTGGGAAITGRGRLATAVALCLLFTLGLIGRMPFWLAVALFVTAFVTLFEWDGSEPPARRGRRIATAALLGLATGWGVVLVFEQLFLVRLP